MRWYRFGKGGRVATAGLFAVAIGAFKNPASRRTVDEDDPAEDAGVVPLADLLTRFIERVEQ